VESLLNKVLLKICTKKNVQNILYRKFCTKNNDSKNLKKTVYHFCVETISFFIDVTKFAKKQKLKKFAENIAESLA